MVSVNDMKSPNIFVSEIDESQSTYSVVVSKTKNIGLIGHAQNGPVGEVVKINSEKEFISVFGEPIDNSGLLAVQILGVAPCVFYERVATDSAAKRTVDVPFDTEETPVLKLTLEAINPGTLYTNSALGVDIKAGTGNKFTLRIIKDSSYELYKGEYSKLATDDDYIGNVTALAGFKVTNTFGTTAPTLTVVPGTYTFSAGNNGVITDNDYDCLIDGLDKYKDSEQIDISLLASFSWNKACYVEYVEKLLEVANERLDCVAIIDFPDDVTYDEAIKIANGTSANYRINELNNSYAASYYNPGMIYNKFTGESYYVPASYGVLYGAAVEYTDNYDQWVAPAGQPRMNITIFTEMKYNLDKEMRDALYDEGRINPVCNFRNRGITALGQKTTLKDSSDISGNKVVKSTNRLNVRFLSIYCKKLIEEMSIPYMFSGISDSNMDAWKLEANSILSSIRTQGGLYDYKISLDNNTTTDELRDHNIMYAVVQLKPTKTADFIAVDIVLKNKSDEFN